MNKRKDIRLKPKDGLTKSLGLRAREVISLVGAGGKTTLMFRLAKELFILQKKVVTTTTTKILEPLSEETPLLLVESDEALLKRNVSSHINQHRHITIAAERLGSGKLKGVSSDLVDGLCASEEIDYVIVEADGAAGRPIKAPREWEPVIPASTTLVVGILGMDGVGQSLSDDHVFQAERVSKITGIPLGMRMTEEGMAMLFTHPEGILRGAPFSSRVIIFLNKVDVPEGLLKGRRVAQKIIERRHPPIDRIILGRLKEEPYVLESVLTSR
ncbi:MAG: hypothetical protein A2170_14285, partial [Deltaproteobacteria bacterium RBG_13_53_10]